MTPNKEDYIKVIYKLGGSEKIISNKSIASTLHVSGASTTEMMNKLVKSEMIEYIPYQGAKLTKNGIRVAKELIRNHRIWEVFLVKTLGFEKSEVHEQAELLEHVSSEELIARLSRFLDTPTHCPHGSEIPSDI